MNVSVCKITKIQTSKKRRLLAIGPMPPPIGGATLAFEKLVKGLGQYPHLEVIVVDTSRPESGKFGTLFVACRTLLAIIIKGRAVDVISFHANSNARIYFGPLVYCLARLYRKPLIVRAFGGTFDEQYIRLNATLKFILRKTYLNADVCLMQTHRLIDFFRPCARRLEWFSNFTGDVGLSDETPFRQKCRRLAFISRVTRTKGIDTLLAALPLLDEDISIDIFGPLDKEYSPALFNGMGDVRLSYRGVLDSREVEQILWEYDALVLPTRWKGEGYPAAILEAYAHGIPVIATRWQSIPEIVDETSGILVDPADVTGFAEAVNRLHRDPGLYRRLQEGARQKAELFSEDYWIEKFVGWCYEVTGASYEQNEM